MQYYSPGKVNRTLFPILLGIEVGIVVIDILFGFFNLSEISSIKKMAMMTREDGLVTWFSSFQFSLVALIACAHGCYHIKETKVRWKIAGWFFVCFFFFLLSLDDTIRLHERIGTIFSDRSLLYRNKNSFISFVVSMFPSYTWQVVVLPVYLVFGVISVSFLWTCLPSSGRLLCFLAGSLYVIAVALDFYEGTSGAYKAPAAYLNTDPYYLQHMLKVLEEFLEMLGTSMFILAFIEGFSALEPPFEIHISKETPTS